jgi:hypothetical protein
MLALIDIQLRTVHFCSSHIVREQFLIRMKYILVLCGVLTEAVNDKESNPPGTLC